MTTPEISMVTVTIAGVAFTAQFAGGDPKAFVKSLVRATHSEVAKGMLRTAAIIEKERPQAAAGLREYATTMLTTDPWPEGERSPPETAREDRVSARPLHHGAQDVVNHRQGGSTT